MRPSTLYRGIVLTQQQFYNLNWYDKDIEVHYKPLLDSQGRKVVLDNNEYGVYMTDNLGNCGIILGNSIAEDFTNGSVCLWQSTRKVHKF